MVLKGARAFAHKQHAQGAQEGKNSKTLPEANMRSCI